MKVQLQKEKGMNRPSTPWSRGVSVTWMLPHYTPRQGYLTHRVRSATVHYVDGKFTHTSVTMWCGHIGSMGGLARPWAGAKGTLSATLPAGGIACAICEGKVVGAGLTGSRDINGVPVLYSPRK